MRKKILLVAGLAATIFFIYKMTNKKEKKETTSTPAGDVEGRKLTISGDGKSGTRGKRNNNPGNIVYNKKNDWKGQIGSDGKFCVFSEMMYGVRALKILLTKSYPKAGRNTINKIIKSFAPSKDGNNTDQYIADVAATTGIDKNKVLTEAETEKVANVICWVESGYNLQKSGLWKIV